MNVILCTVYGGKNVSVMLLFTTWMKYQYLKPYSNLKNSTFYIAKYDSLNHKRNSGKYVF